jgi:hypothetical protein
LMIALLAMAPSSLSKLMVEVARSG